MKYLFLTLLFILLVVLPASAQRTVRRNTPKKPVIRKADAPPPLPAARKTLGLNIEKYVVSYEINRDGTAVKTYEEQRRFDTLAAIEGFGKEQRIINSDLEKVEFLDAYIVKKGTAKKNPVAPENIRTAPTAQAEAAPGFSSLQLFEINFGEIEPGDAIYYKYKVATTKPHFSGHFDDFETLPAIYDWSGAEINISAPADFPLYTQTVGLEGGKLPDENGKARWQWHKTAAKPLEFEVAMYDTIAPSARFNITSFKSYDELGAAFWKASEGKTVVTPEIAELANRITKDITDPRQQASAIYEWVNKNIRYLLIILDRGGWIPHEANQILKSGYGDCKDYTILIHTLLKAKGIESHPVIIRSDFTDWSPDIASPSFYNHAILYIPSLDLFADATAPNTRLGLIPQSIVGKKGFLAGSKTGVIKTPGDRVAENEILSDVVVTYDHNGSIKSFSKNTYRGQTEIAFRPIFSGFQTQALKEAFVSVMLEYYGIQGSGKLSKVGNPFKVGDPFEIEMEVEIPSVTRFSDKGTMPLPVGLNLVNMLEFQGLTLAEKRSTNLIVGAARMQETFHLKYPQSVKITAVPPSTSFESEVGNFRSEFKIEGNSVRAVRSLTINRDTITPAEYPKLRELVKSAVGDTSAEITYETDPQLMTAERKAAEGKTEAGKIPASTSIYEMLRGGAPAKKLTAAQAAKAEAALLKDPNDFETRRNLLAYYSTVAKNTPVNEKARIRHRIWLIQNRPELNDYAAVGAFTAPKEEQDAEYDIIKAEWLKQVDQQPKNKLVRLNSVGYIQFAEPDAAIKLLEDGEKIDAEDYEFPLKVVDLAVAMFKRAETPNEIKEKILITGYEKGETALALLKMERSAERDQARKYIVEQLADICVKLKKFDRARVLATELLLEVEDNVDAYGFQEATHRGNIILGRVALAEGNRTKANEHLLTAMRAPLRSRSPLFYRIDFDLAKELLVKGEKDAVGEFLRMCIEFREKESDKALYGSDIATLKAWFEQVKSGKVPTFDFYKP